MLSYLVMNQLSYRLAPQCGFWSPQTAVLPLSCAARARTWDFVPAMAVWFS